MHQWIETFNAGDLRYILIEYNKDVNEEDLRPYFDVLMREDEVLSQSDGYSHHLEKIDDRLYKRLQITALKLCLTCIELGLKQEAIKIIEEFNFRIKINNEKLIDINAISSINKCISQIQTTLKLNEAQEKEERIKEKNTVWEDLMVYIHQVLNISIDYNCPVSLYRSYEKQAKAKKKQNG